MNKEISFNNIFSRGKVLIPFITAGYPNLNLFEKIIRNLYQSGADIIEIGIPFSDPLADGVTIQKSNQTVLKQGINLRLILSRISRISQEITSPIVIMSYYNPILSYGIKKFINDAKESGISGIIVPDLPFDEREPLYSMAKEKNIKTILMITPVTPLERVREIIKHGDGFIYCVSLIGITGDSKKPLFSWISQDLPNIRKLSPLPIILGFGIDSPETAQKVSPYVDGIVVGSALIKKIDNLIKSSIDENRLLREIEYFIRSLKLAITS
ncbi:MAG: tryptophan synthase subunit alpha [Synergistetes bacterium]|nr:tryptophan synthase subunit alpha [Synergistota bacterium]MCX8128000.1 tryptophan synthase subunit alpha [Synergistota bacterium]MDW8192805.1 tryptophan synthase subunit alpha [Synergistota bacterium]